MKKIGRISNKDLDPEEIFLDSSNLPNFDEDQFEGRIERPISKSAIAIASVFFTVIAIVFVGKIWLLQIDKGEAYKKRSEANSLKHIPVIPDRGEIFDRNGTKLAWNESGGRAYTKSQGLSQLLGYLGYPSEAEIAEMKVEDPKEFVGKDGAEKKFNDWLRGVNGTRIVETDVMGNIISESVYNPGIRGEDITLSVDVGISNKMAEAIRGLSAEKGFTGGAGVMMDVNSGEIIAMANYPEYDGNILSQNRDPKKISAFVQDKRMPFLNRAVSGLYLPGSVIKPIFALGALNENIISPEKEIVSTGSISIPNPYFPDKPSIFKDWKAHGAVDMRKALAVSSDVYFYTIGGGFGGQKGLGILNLEKYARAFGLGEKTGIDLGGEEKGNIPTPEWKAKNFNGEPWNIGDTYHSVIGQYGFQATPLQMVRAISAIANGGRLLQPTVLKIDDEKSKYLYAEEGRRRMGIINISSDKFQVVREGMRKAVTEGTAQGLWLSAVNVAAKTGTAELGISKKYVNAWAVGFFPYEKPRYAFAVVMEKGPVANTVGGIYIMNQLLIWMVENRPEYLSPAP